MTHGQQIGGGLILGLALYVAYLVAAVGVFKTTLFHLLLIELSWMGIYLTLFGLSHVFDSVFESVGLNSGLTKVLSFEMLMVVLLISGTLLCGAILFGQPILIALFSFIVICCLVGISNERTSRNSSAG